ncbi:hypothetical protein SDRG_07726 [Saprolegnia diclina VS20]|uniref:Anaphase-promoting complex subunit 4 WD40 domain-containing protein n=1 Tax=Saprolegnia diclina (strain VS20) TaxID=1156394 RepID=T0RQN7_SAPDV|nr:hypothetical protein SDRG_07726 [Saprolegnia diclina VS20]EQC34928.1 hypothetical protein SDRG_07726 [Saprolegnia diclina VS20]|eukprot:XP_008611800.1 hypothetical protein SDRG_07726 [Saprolegnia diclina VS20]
MLDLLLPLLLLAALAYVGYLVVGQAPKKLKKDDSVAKEKSKEKLPEKVKKPATKPQAKAPTVAAPSTKHADHPLLAHVLKGHTGPITAATFSPNGRFIATASTDRSVRLTLRESLGAKNPTFKTINLPYDYSTVCSFSSDGKTLGVATADGQNVLLYSKFKTKPEVVGSFPVGHNVLSLLLNDIGDEWMTLLTVGRDDDTDIKCWNTTGTLLQTTSVNQIQNFHGVQSLDNRFIAVAAYTPEVKIYEIQRSKTGAFVKLHKAMALQGHTSGVTDIAFDGSDQKPVNRIVTASKDGTVRVWDINVRYKLEEDPKCIKTFQAPSGHYSTVDITPNGEWIAMTQGSSLFFLDVATMTVRHEVLHAQDDAISRIEFDAAGAELLVQGTTSRVIKVYRVPKA